MTRNDVVIIPIKEHSERIPRKNFAIIDGVPLYQIFPTTLKNAGVFDQICIDTDSKEIGEWAEDMGFRWLIRVAAMTSNRANGNTLLRYHAACYPEYARYWQAFVTSPYISVQSVRQMHSRLREGECDSIASVKAHLGFFWDHTGRPISYRPEVMPRSQDLQPIYQEVCGLFGITSESFSVTQTRAGASPGFFALPEVECVDIDWPENLVSANKNSPPSRCPTGS